MKRIIIKQAQENVINVEAVNEHNAVFVKKDEQLIGMVVKEEKGWIIRLGPFGATGHHVTFRQCLESGIDEYEFYLE